jgi:hypothetical protein
MENSKRTAASIVAHLFSHPNPTSGGKPPPHVAWAVFEHGTVFTSYPGEALPLTASADDVRRAALAALKALGPVQAGTPSADFTATHLRDWFPGEFIYWISYDHPSVATIVIAGEVNDLAAGLQGRLCREEDLAGQRIVELHPFQPAQPPEG